jgi:hypothetical protein
MNAIEQAAERLALRSLIVGGLFLAIFLSIFFVGCVYEGLHSESQQSRCINIGGQWYFATASVAARCSVPLQ